MKSKSKTLDKNKQFYIICVLVFCVVLAGVGGFYLGLYFNDDGKPEVCDLSKDFNN